MLCPTCQKEFEPRDSRQKCCSKACGTKRYEKSDDRRKANRSWYGRHKTKIRKKLRKRYKNDPAYRNKFVELMRKRRAEKPEHLRAINAKHRAKPEQREKAKAIRKRWYQDNLDYAKAFDASRKYQMRVDEPWKTIILGALNRSRKKEIMFDLTPEWAKARWTGRCELTDIPFKLGERGVGAKLFSPSIDKIDPAKGYSQANCRFILWMVNAFKYTGDDETMYKVAEALLKRRAFIQALREKHVELEKLMSPETLG